MHVRVITTPNDQSPYLVRITLLSVFGFHVYLHVILRSDEDRALHDHPWPFLSIILAGGYWEHFEGKRTWRKPWSVLRRRATDAHRIELEKESCDPFLLPSGEWIFVDTMRPAVSLVFTGRRWRKWGFLTKDGWVHWKKFLSEDHSVQAG